MSEPSRSKRNVNLSKVHYAILYPIDFEGGERGDSVFRIELMEGNFVSTGEKRNSHYGQDGSYQQAEFPSL
jgi:hypothetical protein